MPSLLARDVLNFYRRVFETCEVGQQVYRRVFETCEVGQQDVLYQADGCSSYLAVAAQRQGEWLRVSVADPAEQLRRASGCWA